MFNVDLDKMKFYGGKKSFSDPDILLITVPRRNPHIFFAAQLPEALARLKACVDEAGFSSYCMDFDNVFFHLLLHNPDVANELDDYFREVLLRNYHGQKDILLSSKALEIYNQFLTVSVDKIIEVKPKWLGVSYFSEQSIRGGFDMLDELKSRPEAKDIKIVCGGLCMELFVEHHNEEEGSRVGDYLVENNLSDYFVQAEGEVALVELLKGNSKYPGINNYNPKQINNLTVLPIADYTDFDFRRYLFPDLENLENNVVLPRITLTGSRGCVKNCSFCNIAYFWPKYRWVEPDQIAHELITYRTKYGVTHFNWTDSLINGSPPKFVKACELLTDYRKTDPDIYSSGQFIIREERQFPAKMFDLMADAGFERISLGIESMSEPVREDMRKYFSNEAIYFNLDNCIRTGIQAECLLMVGYPTEKLEDYQETVNLITQYATASGMHEHPVVFVLSAFGMEYDWTQAPINRNPEEYKIIFDKDLGWTNNNSSYYQALKRRQGLYEYMKTLGLINYADFEREANKAIRYIETKLLENNREHLIKPNVSINSIGIVDNETFI